MLRLPHGECSCLLSVRVAASPIHVDWRCGTFVERDSKRSMPNLVMLVLLWSSGVWVPLTEWSPTSIFHHSKWLSRGRDESAGGKGYFLVRTGLPTKFNDSWVSVPLYSLWQIKKVLLKRTELDWKMVVTNVLWTKGGSKKENKVLLALSKDKLVCLFEYMCHMLDS